MLGDSMIDLQGTQETDSLHYVNQLCELIGVGLSKPFAPVKDLEGRSWKCASCQRTVPPRRKCFYCGGSAGPHPDDEQVNEL
jgi:hypothetical protein